jgi:uncharacterized membrane protein
MREIVIAYLVVAVTMVALDFGWLSLTMDPLYRRALGSILAEHVNMMAAVSFYLIYVAGVVFLAVWPAFESGNWRGALLRGAVLGLVAYGTYDLTNMATLKVWALQVTLLDMAWGAFLTATAAGVGAAITLALEK